MRLLITGASGLLGINLAMESAKRHIVFGTTNRLSLKTNAFTTIQTDLLARGAVERLLEQTRPDWVIHCAALANLDACEADPALASQLNTELPRQLATLCARGIHFRQNAGDVTRGGARENAVPPGLQAPSDRVRLVYISTDAVFDGQRGDYSEEDQPSPLGVYARTKLEGEQAVAEADPTAIIARVNLFGWSIRGKRSLAEFFFHNLSAGNRVMGFSDVFFCPLLANDMAGILERMLEKNLSGVYHLVSSECLSKYEFGVHLAQRFNLDARLIAPTSVQQAGLKAARAPNLSLRSNKLAQALGEPLPTISPALEHFYTLYQQGYPQQLQQLLLP